METSFRALDEGLWRADSGREGPKLCISFGVHGDERPPIDAGLALVRELQSGVLTLDKGALLLVHANPRATAEHRRWSDGGVDLNRSFHPSVLCRDPGRYEERRAQALVRALDDFGGEALVDFHCTVEPGRRFLMQHPPIENAPHRNVWTFLAAETLLADPDLRFGGVSLDESMSTRGRVGICYETGWLGDPALTPKTVLAEMKNLLVGLELVSGVAARKHPTKRLLVLDRPILCTAPGFRWNDGIGTNLQALPSGTQLGRYENGALVTLTRDATLIFPKKRPELVELGKPLVQLARAV
jgi:predicted deacylase